MIGRKALTVRIRLLRLFVLAALLLAPLGSLHADHSLPEVPIFEKLRVGSFQSLENCDAMTSNDWN
jgi:hypothetical protein